MVFDAGRSADPGLHARPQDPPIDLRAFPSEFDGAGIEDECVPDVSEQIPDRHRRAGCGCITRHDDWVARRDQTIEIMQAHQHATALRTHGLENQRSASGAPVRRCRQREPNRISRRKRDNRIDGQWLLGSAVATGQEQDKGGEHS